MGLKGIGTHRPRIDSSGGLLVLRQGNWFIALNLSLCAGGDPTIVSYDKSTRVGSDRRFGQG